ncbi:MAG TPA: UvrD-helicase domain-containing protein [Solirubrobacteraceae bacterium]
MATDQYVERLLEGLNEPQRAAVTHGDGPLLILAGAGSGKTRVLTHRIAWLNHTGRARANEVLAITFTNKAAQEMRERVEGLVGRRTRAMWVMTFHAACARMLRAEADKLGYTKRFTIYDQADARRLVKRCLDTAGVDPKRFTPASVHNQISDAKNKLRDAEAYRELMGSYFEQTVGEVYELYEKELIRMNAMDFDDLLVRAVNVLELFPEVRDRYGTAFRHILVDEYQDTNHAQYRWLQLLTTQHRNLAVVGDDAQCLAAGTLVTMGDGSRRPIENVQVGEEVLSSYGGGDFRPARVTDTFAGHRPEGIAITLRSGRRIVSTPEHTHFAGFRPGLSPHRYLTYLMVRGGMGFRVGTTANNLQGRAMQEHADAAWVISSHASDAQARAEEIKLSLRYGLPMLPFVARKGGHGVVADQSIIDDVFASVDNAGGGLRLLRDHGLSVDHPHVTTRSFEGRRRNVTITLCADRRGATPMHLVAVGGRDPQARRALEDAGLSVRPAKRGSESWRYESVFKDFGRAAATVERIRQTIPATVRPQARLAAKSLPFMPASSVRPGMVMFDEDGGFDVVEAVERVALDAPVYDINVEGTHNFVADGVVTHNSIYGFRGADINNILDFEKDYEDARVVKLEQNYRSTQTILNAANAVIANNRAQKPKHLWSDLGSGDKIVVRELDDEHAEARYVVGQIARLVEAGTSLNEIAVFYRTNAQSRVLEDTLVRNETSYQVVGGTKFYDRAEIKDAIAYLILLSNPQDAISFARVANSPKRGIGATSLGRVLGHADTMGISVWEAAEQPGSVPGLGTAAVKALGRFMDVMVGLRERVADGVPVGDLLEAVLHDSGYLDALEAERTIEAEGRVENLRALVEGAREFDAMAEEGEDTLDDFLQQVALQSDADTRRDDEGVVTLMTLHNAKGLEYPIVFMIGCEEGVFPHSRALDEGGLEEERRLCYVGITRAKKELTITYARRRNVFGAQTFGMRSRFVDEIPGELTDREEPVVAAGRARPGAWAAASQATAERAGDTRRRGGGAVGVDFRMGDDVVHAAFGDGVVTGVEPGGIVVIRFASDGSERKLMAEYAPISKR